MNNDNVYGWYDVSTKPIMYDRDLHKKLFLDNWNPSGTSAFYDENGKLYLIPTCNIECMLPASKEFVQDQTFFVPVLRHGNKKSLNICSYEAWIDCDCGETSVITLPSRSGCYKTYCPKCGKLISVGIVNEGDKYYE